MSITEIPSGAIEKAIDLLIDVVPKLATLSLKERESYRKKIEETYRLFDEVIILMMNRLGVILSLQDDNQDEFFKELRNLYNIQEWQEKERDVRLCGPIRTASRELNSVLPKIKAKISLKDNDEVRIMFNMIEGGEGPFANYITDSLRFLTEFEEQQPHTHEKYLEGRKLVKKMYDKLSKKRTKLVEAELKLKKVI